MCRRHHIEGMCKTTTDKTRSLRNGQNMGKFRTKLFGVSERMRNNCVLSTQFDLFPLISSCFSFLLDFSEHTRLEIEVKIFFPKHFLLKINRNDDDNEEEQLKQQQN